MTDSMNQVRLNGTSEEQMELDQVKREKVFQAAKELFGRFGFKKTTVDEIAEQAGISKRTVYQVFRCKEEILAELVMYEARAFRHHCTQMLKTMEDPMEKLRFFCLLWRDYFAENRFLCQVLGDEMGMFAPFLTQEMTLIETGQKEVIARLITDGENSGAFRSLNLASSVDCILVLLRRFTIEAPDPQKDASGWISFIINAVKA